METHNKKYNIVLRYVNSILLNAGKDEIDNLVNFKDICRDDLLTDKNKLVFNEYKKEAFDYFDKKKMGYYRIKEVQYYFLTFLRCSLKEIGYKLTYNEKKSQEDNKVSSKIYYSIVKFE